MLPDPFPKGMVDLEFNCPSGDFRYRVHVILPPIALPDQLQLRSDTVEEVRKHMVRGCVNRNAYIQIKKEHDDRHVASKKGAAKRSVPVSKQKKKGVKRSRGKIERPDEEEKARASALLISLLNGGGSGLIDLMVKVPRLITKAVYSLTDLAFLTAPSGRVVGHGRLLGPRRPDVCSSRRKGGRNSPVVLWSVVTRVVF